LEWSRRLLRSPFGSERFRAVLSPDRAKMVDLRAAQCVQTIRERMDLRRVEHSGFARSVKQPVREIEQSQSARAPTVDRPSTVDGP